MHTCARHKSSRLFRKGEGEGVAVSQYDLAEVQMGFSVICLALLEDQLHLDAPPLTPEEKGAMVHLWRYIGYHLGIQDEYNACLSLASASALLDDYMPWTPQRLETCRETTHALQRLCCDGFGAFTGAGVAYFEAFMCALQTSKWADVRYV